MKLYGCRLPVEEPVRTTTARAPSPVVSRGREEPRKLSGFTLDGFQDLEGLVEPELSPEQVIFSPVIIGRIENMKSYVFLVFGVNQKSSHGN